MNRLLFDWAFLSKFSVWVYLYTTTDHTYRSSSPSPVLHQSLAFNDNNNSVLYNESTRQIAQFVFQHYQCRRWLQRAISRRIFWMTHLVILLTFDWSAPKNHQWMFTHFITASTVENSMLSTSCCRGHMSQLANIVRDREREREQKSQACLSSAKRIGKFVSVFFSQFTAKVDISEPNLTLTKIIASLRAQSGYREYLPNHWFQRKKWAQLKVRVLRRAHNGRKQQCFLASKLAIPMDLCA